MIAPPIPAHLARRFGRRPPMPRAQLAVLLLMVASCGPSSHTTQPPVAPPEVKAPPLRSLELEDIPVAIEAERLAPAPEAISTSAPVLDVMEKENQRWMQVLATAPKASAFYLAYEIHDRSVVAIEGQDGTLVADDAENFRFLDVDVRVGSLNLDNRHTLSGVQSENRPLIRRGRIPFGADEAALRHHLWLETDRRHREAVEHLGWVESEMQVTGETSEIPDFVRSQPETFIGEVAELTVDRELWRKRVRRCSARARTGVATRGSCQVLFERSTRYLVNSEGTKVRTSDVSARLNISMGVKADDGMPLSRLSQHFARSAARLPSDAEIDAIITTLSQELTELHGAPVAEPYAGPILLDGRAAAVFFHEVFGHRIEGHRQKQRTSGQTFAKKISEAIMPPWISVYDDPRIQSLNGVELHGTYRFDNEGVASASAPLVEGGVLKGFIMGRNPIAGFEASNGHGRREAGYPPVSRQGNLVVTAAKSVSRQRLQALLLEEVQRQSKPYGLIVTDIMGGHTNTEAFDPQSFRVQPTLAYRLFPDGRKEMVRGINIIGTPLIALASIRAAGRPVEIFNGVCGAESGWVPVAAAAPSLLLERLEVERTLQLPPGAPILPTPSLASEPFDQGAR